MKNYSLISLLLSLILGLSACNNHYYKANEGINIGISQKGEAKIQTSTGLTGAYPGALSAEGNAAGSYINAQAGYSPIQSWAVAVNYNLKSEMGGRFNINSYKSDIHAFDFAIGRYKFIPIRSSKIKKEHRYQKGFLIDSYLGYGRGRLKHFTILSDSPLSFPRYNRFELNYQNIFLQGGAHFQKGILKIGAIMGFDFIDYRNGQILGYAPPALIKDVDRLRNQDPIVKTYLTAYLELKMKYWSVYFHLGAQNISNQLSRSFNYGEENNNTKSIGIRMNIHEVFPKMKK